MFVFYYILSDRMRGIKKGVIVTGSFNTRVDVFEMGNWW